MSFVISASSVKDLRDKTGVSMMACKKALEETQGDIQAAIELLRKRGEAVAQKRSSHAAKEGRIVAGRGAGVVALVEVVAETDFTARNDDFGTFVDAVSAIAIREKPASIEALLAATGAELGGRSVQQANMDLVGKIGENISVRRVSVAEAKGEQTVEAYIHGMGKIGVLVTLSHPGKATAPGIQTLAKDLCMQIAAASPAAVSSEQIPESVLDKEREIAREQAANEGIAEAKLPMVVEGRIKKFLKDAALVEQLFVKDNKLTISKLLDQVAKQEGVAKISIDGFVRFQLGEGA